MNNNSTPSTSTSTPSQSSKSSGKLRDRVNLPSALPLNNNTNSNNYNNDDDNNQDLAVASNGSFIETTSASAAKALAKWYSTQGNEEFAIQSRIENGKTIYRIRPRSHHSISLDSLVDSPSPSPIPVSAISFPSVPSTSPTPSSPSSPNPTFKIQNPSPRKSSNSTPTSARQWVLRTSKSIPLLRSHKSNNSPSPTNRNFNDSFLQLPPSPNSILGFTSTTTNSNSNSNTSSPTFSKETKFKSLRKSGSTPTLSSNVSRLRTKSSLANLNAKTSQGDVLGRLLGWNDDEEGRRSKRSESNGSKSPLGSPLLTEKKEIKESTIIQKSTESISLPKRTRSDSLPISFTSSSINAPILLHRANTTSNGSHLSPFGVGVRLPRRSASEGISSTSSPEYLEPSVDSLSLTSKSMREATSTETIRIPKESITKKRKRFQDAEIFDLFQILDSSILTSTSTSTPTTPNSFNQSQQHKRQLSSSSSITSSVSSTSGAAAHLITVTSTPGDDPRFVIWGQKNSKKSIPPPIPPLPSIYSGSFTNRRASIVQEMDIDSSPSFIHHGNGNGGGSPATTSSSRRWSFRDSKRTGNMGSSSSPATSIRESLSSVGGGGGREKVNTRILMAATVERLVAELTSKIEVELLCGFFLTYRSFVRPLDLLKLLITRFDWAMSTSTSPEDEAGKRIVRVRTFVVLRHWLLNFFSDDFIPDKRLRTTLTEWLNFSSKDIRIKSSPKDQRLIKGLKKIVKKLKEIHVVLGPTETAAAAKVLLNSSTGGLQVPVGLGNLVDNDDLDLRGGLKDNLDEDVDLELEGTSTPRPSIINSPTFPSPKLPKPSTFTRTSQSKTIPNQSVPFSTSTTTNNPNFSLPNSQNVIARSFTSALGSFGRFKRMLGNRNTSNSHSISNSKSIHDDNEEFEKNETGDLLWLKDGLAKYLAYYDIHPEEEEEEGEAVIEKKKVEQQQEEETVYTFPSLQSTIPIQPESPTITGLGIAGALEDTSSQYLSSPSPSSSTQSKSFKSSTFIPRGGYGNRSPLGFMPSSFEEEDSYSDNNNNNDIFFLSHRPHSGRIELDDVDLSDEDEDVVEVKKTLKRLPAAHNLKLVTTLNNLNNNRNSLESISSFVSPRIPSFHYTKRGGIDQESMIDSDEDLSTTGVQVVPNFILEGIDSDDDEPGDVEAALRRLEGLVDDSKEKEKAKKVEKQMEKSLKLKLAVEDGTNQIDTKKLDEEIILSESTRPSIDAVSSLASSLDSPTSPNFPIINPINPREAMVIEEPLSLIPPDRPNQRQINSSQPRRKSIVKSAIPRKASFSKLLETISRPLSVRPTNPNISPPPTHRSFILSCRTEVLAQQFCLIERDMLRVLSWQELVGGSWRDRNPTIEVLDWEIYLKERRVKELEIRSKGGRNLSDAVQSIIMRFNLTANWVCSEIVLTANIDDRATLIGKFIRLAFKCYCQSNFQTLTQIIHGLQSQDIERLHKTWARVPSWEMRKFRNMKLFVSHFKNFKLLREVTNSLISEYGPPGQRTFNDSSKSTSSKSTKAPPPLGCIPFLGLFLRDLTLNAELPTFLDPTSPNLPANTDEHGSLKSTSNPSAFNNLNPLPIGLGLQPLVNVHKFRMLANLVQNILAFQEFSEGYEFGVEVEVYFKCLKIKCLSSGVIRECSIRLAQV